MVRQSRVQAVPGEPADRRIDLRLAHQAPVAHDAQRKPGEHQPNGGLRLDPGAPDAGSVEVGHLIAQPRQIEHAIHPSQDVIVRNQITQRAADEELQLVAVLMSDQACPHDKSLRP